MQIPYGPTIYQVYYQNKAVPAELPDVLASHAGLSAADWRTHLSMSPVYFRTQLKTWKYLGTPRCEGHRQQCFTVKGWRVLILHSTTSRLILRTVFPAYLRNDLKYNATVTYVVESNAISYWNFSSWGNRSSMLYPIWQLR